MLPLFCRGAHRAGRLRPPCGHRRARRAGGCAARALPDHARAGRYRDRLSSGRSNRGARPGHRAPDLPPAAPVRRGVLHLGARAAPERPSDRGPRDPARVRDDGRGGGRGPRGRGAGLGGVVRARRDRLADRRGRARRDPAPSRGAAAAARDRRGREPHERLDRPDPLPRRDRRRGVRLVLALGGGPRVHRKRHRRPGRRPGRGLGDPAGPLAHRRPAHRDHDLDPLRVRGLPARGGTRLLRRDRGGHDRHLHGLVHASAHDPRDAPPGCGDLGDPDLPAECAAVPARGASAARDPRRPLRARDRRAAALGCPGEPGGDRRPARLDVHRPRTCSVWSTGASRSGG